MTNPLGILQDACANVIDYVFGKPGPVEKIRVSGLTYDASSPLSAVEQMAMKQGLIPAVSDKPLNSASNVPSVVGLREQLKPEPTIVERNVFAKPIFRRYFPGQVEGQRVTGSSLGNYAWK
ncbi:hypothetical protein FJZ17_03790 [Candidatus Pacearchaeota archaeon]|nr:hypothetical protein [Candidatus Pacearchaeota archaeon]